MRDHAYKIIELVGSSEKSIEDAIEKAIARAAGTLHNMGWFEVVETRGHIVGGAKPLPGDTESGIYSGSGRLNSSGDNAMEACATGSNSNRHTVSSLDAVAPAPA